MNGHRVRKLWRACIAIVVLGVVFSRKLESVTGRYMPFWALVVIEIMILTYLISLVFSWKLPAWRRLGTAYLAVVGLTYLLPGICGLFWATGLIETDLLAGLIDPYVLYYLYSPTSAYIGYAWPDRPFDFAPLDSHPAASAVVVLVSIIAIAGAFAMGKSLKAGYWIWGILLVLSLPAIAGYVALGIARTG